MAPPGSNGNQTTPGPDDIAANDEFEGHAPGQRYRPLNREFHVRSRREFALSFEGNSAATHVPGQAGAFGGVFGAYNPITQR